jgi:AraC-like DNA-binding protein/predicted enzyme related to lactoylglutathione lyase
MMTTMKAGTVKDHQAAVASVLRLIRDVPAENVDSLARVDVAGMSRFHLDRVFKQQTGRTPGEHARMTKLLRAAIALRTTRRRIVQIALESGYANHESFSRAFRRQFGLAPNQYRRKHQASKQGHTMKDLHPAVNLIKIPVTDFARARGFYRDVLGLEEEYAVDEYGWAQYAAGDLPICLYVVGMGGGDGKPGNELNFHLAVDNAKQAFSAIGKRGGTFACDLTSDDEGGAFFIVADPDGNRLKIVQRT